jgi:allantoicase
VTEQRRNNGCDHMVVVLIELGIIFKMAVDTKSPCFEDRQYKYNCRRK